ncbi:hypothetical protein BC833DRAFT_574253 [Globomyces pollinis-pini]|nr:hypothetical protein BC833DRAFT_574253 [Globomyces pollinis-pini]
MNYITIILSALSVMSIPAERVVNPNAIKSVVCTQPNVKLDFHDINVAQLQICGGIAGKIQKCQGNPTSTTGISGTAKFIATPKINGSTINVSKGRWEQGIAAGLAKCGQSPVKGIIPLGTSNGDLIVRLKENK